MTVGELKEIIKDLDDDDVILEKTSDHHYSEAQLYVGTALYDGLNDIWTEDCGERPTPESVYGERFNVLIIY